MSLSLANCSSSYKDDCQAQIDCEGGNDKDVDACVDENKGAEDIADAYDCGDQYSDYADCVEGKGTCQNGKFQITDQSCLQKALAVAACIKAASGNPNGAGGDL